jgi:hypothetical protein
LKPTFEAIQCIVSVMKVGGGGGGYLAERTKLGKGRQVLLILEE